MASLNLAPPIPSTLAAIRAPQPQARRPAPGTAPRPTIAKSHGRRTPRVLNLSLERVKSSLPEGAKHIVWKGWVYPCFGTTLVHVRPWGDKSAMQQEIIEVGPGSTFLQSSRSGMFFEKERLLVRYPQLQHFYHVKSLPENANGATGKKLHKLLPQVVRHVLRQHVLAHVSVDACKCRPSNLSEHSLEWREMRLKRAYHLGMDFTTVPPQPTPPVFRRTLE